MAEIKAATATVRRMPVRESAANLLRIVMMTIVMAIG